MHIKAAITKKKAFRFILLLGCVSLFADMTYEGARSINGPFLQALGASGTVVGVTAGLGELVGYGLRWLSGYISDRSHKYWLILITGYILNLISVPLLAFAGYWQIAVILMIAERAGKAIRSPTRDALLSYASSNTGHGWGFGLHAFMDQLGATLGPLLVSAVLYYRQDHFNLAYGILLFPALAALSVLIAAKRLHPKPQELEIKTIELKDANSFSSPGFTSYTVAAICLATGYADYPLIAYHFKQQAVMADAWIAMLYAVAMLTEAITALVTGRLFDRIGSVVLVISVIFSMFFPPLVFSANAQWAVIGMVLWGIGMGVQGSILKAVIADMIPAEKRATAFGLFDAVFGVTWFIGSAYMGYLYDRSITGVVIFSMNMQLLSIIFLIAFITWKKRNPSHLQN